MSDTIVRARTWLEARGLGLGGLSAFLSKPIPRNVGWIHTLGALLLTYLGFQFLTGILLAFYYSNAPESASMSLRYLREELWLGAFLLKLHKAGAAFVLVTAFLHFARSFFLGAYKAPRELLWVTGLLLGALLTLFAFTGQLLPYDQRGYWATEVGIEIASAAPLLGDFVRDLLQGGYGSIGATTLSRFFILHVCVLPLAFLALVGLHLAILQRTGSAGPVRGSPEPTRSFYPAQMVKDVVVSAGGALLLFAVAYAWSPIDTGPADPSAAGFVPRPEWYFYAHFEAMRLLGEWGLPAIVGTFVLPNLVFVLLLALPFYDRNPERAPERRKLALTLGVLGCALMVGLTASGLLAEPAHAAPAQAAKDPVAFGRTLFREKDCSRCHVIEGREGGDLGPRLDGVGRRLQPDYLESWVRNPLAFKPDTQMPPFEGSEEELQAILAYLQASK